VTGDENEDEKADETTLAIGSSSSSMTEGGEGDGGIGGDEVAKKGRKKSSFCSEEEEAGVGELATDKLVEEGAGGRTDGEEAVEDEVFFESGSFQPRISCSSWPFQTKLKEKDRNDISMMRAVRERSPENNVIIPLFVFSVF